MQLSGSEAIFSINVIGDKTKETFMGEFTVKCIMSPMDLIKSDKLYRNLIGDNPHFANQDVREYAFVFSQLQFRIVKSPSWWELGEINGQNVQDRNVLITIMNNALEAEELYIKEKTKQQEEMQNRLTESIKSNKIKKKATDLETPLTDEPDEV